MMRSGETGYLMDHQFRAEWRETKNSGILAEFFFVHAHVHFRCKGSMTIVFQSNAEKIANNGFKIKLKNESGSYFLNPDEFC